MSKHEEADLILKLYDLRREPTIRKAREWYFRDFNPQSVADVSAALFGEQSGYLRMVWSYWDMAAALVNHGSISWELFNDTNGEHIAVFLKMEPILAAARAEINPHLLVNVEKLIDAMPEGRAKLDGMRERMKEVRAKMAAPGAQASSKN
ncbi:MAG TPA: hypothetical protein VMF91_08815 [Bryobacteraceae bacterium]|nr:hypothetical protein [Bryobacteraceae bacterium]